jgi:hypothetical protein
MGADQSFMPLEETAEPGLQEVPLPLMVTLKYLEEEERGLPEMVGTLALVGSTSFREMADRELVDYAEEEEALDLSPLGLALRGYLELGPMVEETETPEEMVETQQILAAEEGHLDGRGTQGAAGIEAKLKSIGLVPND